MPPTRRAHVTQELLKHLDRAARLEEVGMSRSRTSAQVAIRWVLDQPGVSCAIVGAKTPEQVEENFGALGWRLSEAESHSVTSI